MDPHMRRSTIVNPAGSFVANTEAASSARASPAAKCDSPFCTPGPCIAVFSRMLGSQTNLPSASASALQPEMTTFTSLNAFVDTLRAPPVDRTARDLRVLDANVAGDARAGSAGARRQAIVRGVVRRVFWVGGRADRKMPLRAGMTSSRGVARVLNVPRRTPRDSRTPPHRIACKPITARRESRKTTS
eukprot:31447-Pelagococcus_subviridis.AAC.15